MAKHRQQSTKVKAEGTDLIESDLGLLLFFFYYMQSLHSQRPTYISQLCLSSMSTVLHSEIQPGIDCVVLEYLLLKIPVCKWTHEVQNHLIQTIHEFFIIYSNQKNPNIPTVCQLIKISEMWTIHTVKHLAMWRKSWYMLQHGWNFKTLC